MIITRSTREESKVLNWWRGLTWFCVAAVSGFGQAATTSPTRGEADDLSQSSEMRLSTSGISKNPEANVTYSVFLKPEEIQSAQTQTNEPNAIERALEQAPELTVTTNFVVSAERLAQEARLKRFQFAIDLARKQRKDRDFAQAAMSLQSILESDAPDELKRLAFLESAFVAQQAQQHLKAQRIFSKYIWTYPEDPSVPEITLRQGLLFREMGMYDMSISKFYAVMSVALNIKHDRWDYYKRVVLQAQTEIAETFYQQGKYDEAGKKFNALLTLDNPELRKDQIQLKLILCFAYAGLSPEVVAQAHDFVKRYPDSIDLAEVRFHLVNALTQLGRDREALEQVLVLLKSQETTARQNPENWKKWQQRTGNQVANQLYKEGNYADALVVYQTLVHLDNSLFWQLPVMYQIGLVLERLQMPAKAREFYTAIGAREKELEETGSPSVKAIIEMAKWRQGFLDWQTQAEKSNLQVRQVQAPETSSLP
jgi:tetratricopeptide (TPR) repeat protein